MTSSFFCVANGSTSCASRRPGCRRRFWTGSWPSRATASCDGTETAGVVAVSRSCTAQRCRSNSWRCRRMVRWRRCGRRLAGAAAARQLSVSFIARPTAPIPAVWSACRSSCRPPADHVLTDQRDPAPQVEVLSDAISDHQPVIVTAHLGRLRRPPEWRTTRPWRRCDWNAICLDLLAADWSAVDDATDVNKCVSEFMAI